MIKKKVPIWTHESFVLPIKEDFIIRSAFSDKILLNTLQSTYIYFMKNNQIQKLAIKVEEWLASKDHESYFFSYGTNQRYELHIYNSQTLEFELIKCAGLIPKRKKFALVKKIGDLIYVIGGKSTNKYQISQNIYYLNLTKLNWSILKIPNHIKDKLDNQSCLIEIMNNNLYIFSIKFEENIYNEIIVYSLNDNKIIEIIQLKIGLKFKNNVQIKTKGNQIFVFDLNNLYRLRNNEKSVSKINRGVYLVEPKQPFTFRFEDNLAVIYNTEFGFINRWSIEEEDFEQIEMGQENYSLQFYFNKEKYSDIVFSLEQREIHCSRQLFQFYSRKLKKIWLDQKEQKSKTIIKLELKFPTFYFLIQQLYNQLKSQLKFDEETMLELLVFSNKLQVIELQKKCQEVIIINQNNFQQLYDFYRNVDTYSLRDRLFKYFVSNYKELRSSVPIGKVDEIVRCLYQAECFHTNVIQVQSGIADQLKIIRKDKIKSFSKFENIQKIIQQQKLKLQICEKCNKVLNLSKMI